MFPLFHCKMRRYDGDAKECSPQYWRKSSRPFQNFFHRFDRRVIPRVPASAGPTQMCTIPERLIFHRVGGGWVGEKSKAAGIVCPDSFVGCDWLLTIHGGLLEWRQRSSPPGSRRASEVPTPGFPAREREAPLRDQNGQ